MDQLQKALELDPNFLFTYIIIAHAYGWKGMYEESFAACEKLASLYHSSPYNRALPSLILAMAGKPDEAKKILSELKRHPKLDPLSLIRLAETCSVLGEKTEAFEFLETAYQERIGLLISSTPTRILGTSVPTPATPTFGNGWGCRSCDPRHPHPEASQSGVRKATIIVLNHKQQEAAAKIRLPQRPQADKPDLPPVHRQYRLACERNLPENPRLVPD